VRRLLADLHIHTALSPCAADEMTPPAIVEAALAAGLAMIAVCDHNAAGNAAAVQEAAARRADGRRRLAVLAGIEITTAEEVHLLGLFPCAAAAEAAADEVRATLPAAGDAARRFGEQRLLDAGGAQVGNEAKMLSAASALALAEAVRLVKRHGGLAVPSHVDRPSFSVLSQLGFLPADAGFDALEISGFSVGTPRVAELEAYGLAVLGSSDSHSLGEIGRVRSAGVMASATFEELVRALRREGGRSLRCA